LASDPNVGAALIVIVYWWLATAPTASFTLKVKVKTPALVGVPLKVTVLPLIVGEFKPGG